MKKNYNSVFVALFFLSFACNKFFGQCTYTTGVPYIQNFAGVSTASPLPQCWSQIGATGTSSLGNGTAFFNSNPTGANYFLTHGIQLYSGITYSTSIWYSLSNSGSTNWSSFSILLGTTQSTTGMSSIASTSTLVNIAWTAMSNTFNVSSSGIYYFALRGISNNTLGANTLSIDDFAITIPCSLNQFTVTIVPSSTAICQGNSFTIAASGANTYTWNTGATGNSIIVSPNSTSGYNVIGTNTLTGCSFSNTAIPNIIVNPSPNVSIFNPLTILCQGNSIQLSGFGADTYTWSNGTTGIQTIISPSITSIYSVTGTAANGCSNTQTISILVDKCTSINEYKNQINFKFYPNPVKEILNFDGEFSNIKLEIINTLGEIVLQKNNFDSSQSLDVRDLKSGIYFLKIFSNSKIETIRLIKE